MLTLIAIKVRIMNWLVAAIASHKEAELVAIERHIAAQCEKTAAAVSKSWKDEQDAIDAVRSAHALKRDKEYQRLQMASETAAAKRDLYA